MTPNGLHRLLETNCNDSELHYRLSEKQRALEKMGKFHIQAVDNGKVSNSTVFQQKKCAEREGKQKMKVAEVQFIEGSIVILSKRHKREVVTSYK